MGSPEQQRPADAALIAAIEAFDAYMEITGGDSDGSLERNAKLADMVGDDDLFYGLVASTSEIFSQNPNAFKRYQIASPELGAYMAGLIVGANVARKFPVRDPELF